MVVRGVVGCVPSFESLRMAFVVVCDRDQLIVDLVGCVAIANSPTL